MDILALGSAFLTANKPTQPIKIKYPDRPEYACVATLTETKVNTSDKLKLQSQYINFLVTKNLLPYPANRGMLIIWQNKVYEVIFEGIAMWSFNDQFQNEILLRTVYKHACG